MTLSRQPIRILSGALLASALYATSARAQVAAEADSTAEASVAAKAPAAPKWVAPAKPAGTYKWVPSKPAAAKTSTAKSEEAAKPEVAVAPEVPAVPAIAAKPVVTAPAPPSKAAAKPWLRSKAPQAVASAPTTSPWRLGALGAVVAGLGAAALFQRRRRTSLARAVRSDLTVMSAVRVGNKAQVVVVNVGGRKLLLGVTEAEVSRLAWLEGEIEASGIDTEEDALASAAQGALGDSELFAPGVLPAVTRQQAVATPKEQPRRFRDLLFNALGHEAPVARAASPARPTPSAADEIAEGTRDVVTRGAAPRDALTRASAARVASPAGAPEMVDIEGQARGLVLRLQKRA